MNRQQRRGIMKELRTFMESISGRKFKTLMESFRAGVAAILEAGGADYSSMGGVLAQDIGLKGVFDSLQKRGRDIEKDVNELITIRENLGTIPEAVTGKDPKTGKDFGKEIEDAIGIIDDYIDVASTEEDRKEVSDSVKSEINNTIDKVNNTVAKINDGLKKLGKGSIYLHAPDISKTDEVKTFADFKRCLSEIKSKLGDMYAEYENILKTATKYLKENLKSSRISKKYRDNPDLLLRKIRNTKKYKEKLADLEADSKNSANDIDQATMDVLGEELERIKRPYFGNTINTLNFAAATILFYSIAAKKEHFETRGLDLNGSEHMLPGSPRENIVLALYALSGGAAIDHRNKIIKSTYGIDWENFETIFKFELVSRAIRDTGSLSLDKHSLPMEIDDQGSGNYKKIDEASGNVWIKNPISGKVYTVRNNKFYDGSGNLVSDPKNFGLGSGKLEICYNVGGFVSEGMIANAEKIYDDSIELATLILDIDGNGKDENDIAKDIVENDGGSTALCIFYSYINKSSDFDGFKMKIKKSMDSQIANLVKELRGEAQKDSAMLEPIDKHYAFDAGYDDDKDVFEKAGDDVPIEAKNGAILHKMTSIAKYDTTGILGPIIDRLKNVKNGEAININPPQGIKSGVGEDNKFGQAVLVFGLPDVAISDMIATREGPFKATQLGKWFPPIKTNGGLFNDSIKNATTFASIVAQIYSLIVFLSGQENINPDFIDKNIKDNYVNNISDGLQKYLTLNMCKAITKPDVDVSGEFGDDESGICKFIESVIGADGKGVGKEPGGIKSLRVAYNKLLDFVNTPESEMDWQASEDIKKLSKKDDGRPSKLVAEYRRLKNEKIGPMVERIREMVEELPKRDPKTISYGDLVYFMIYGGLGLTTAEKNTYSGGTYYEPFLNLVKNYEELRDVSMRISIEVCGMQSDRVARMAAGILLLIVSIKNEYLVEHYNTIEEYAINAQNIDEEIANVEEKMGAEGSNNIDEETLNKIKEKYEELLKAKRTERRKVIAKIDGTAIGTATKLAKSDFNEVIGGILGNVSYDGKTNKMNVESAADIGDLLIATISGDMNEKYSKKITADILPNLAFSKSAKYIKSLNKKSMVDGALIDLISKNDYLNRDTEFSNYNEEYEAVSKRAADKENKDNVIDELKVITHDQIKDALFGENGLLTDNLNMVDRACKAILFYLITKTNVFGDSLKAEVSSVDIEKMMNDILKENDVAKERRTELVNELKRTYNDDEKGSVKTFINSINNLFGHDKINGGISTKVLTILADEAGN